MSDKKRQLTGPQPVDWREFAWMQKQLDNLLSRIHSGSQYQKEHGTAKAVADAHDIVAQLLADRDVLAAEVRTWRNWFDREPETIITEPLEWQDVINKRAATDAAKAMEKKR